MNDLTTTFQKYFPDKTIREQQKLTFDFIEANKDKKHLILEVPTGGGKSLIGMTYGLASGEQFFVTTPQKMLQKQYVDTISSDLIGTFYGRSNYRCVWSNELDELDCKSGHVPTTPCVGCPYSMARNDALAKKATILNTALQFNNTYTQKFQERRILVIDEAHSLERVLCDYESFVITKTRCKQLKIKFPKLKGGMLSEFLKFVEHDLIPALELNIEVFKNDNPIIEYILECEKNNEEPQALTISDKRTFSYYEKLVSALETTIDNHEDATVHPDLYVLCSAGETIEMKYKRAHVNFEKYINSQYDHIIYMSATFVDLHGFAQSDLGIKKSDYAALQLPPFFKNEGGCFKYIPVRKNNATMSDKDFTAILMQVIEIIKHHADKKGILHCVNYQQKGTIVEVLEAFDITVFTHEGADDKQDQLEKFMKYSSGSVFVSPSSTEGLDLPDDLCRYIIFTKVPWLSLGDEWVKERMKDGDWYLRQALTATVQGAGRGIRHEKDWCDVYFLDENFDRIINVLPKWYIDQLKNGAK